ncbi:hypothetical protein E2562_022405 [Oryza meyeriana var. granulata]|uniref:Uncharacterized protein n=1 Tax=Oryza meyeriana var. granulata TaxID=110450 RepID=A0A6G1EY71_9ORYZ|nr:hypothetical protein E2562_022405 [Oryza meyeriana var. granulata]
MRRAGVGALPLHYRLRLTGLCRPCQYRRQDRVNKLGQGDCGSVCKGDENYDATMNQASIENNYNNLLLFQLYRQPHLQAASEASPRAKEASHFQFPLLFSPACNVTEETSGFIRCITEDR